jgi:hypothetical protein
MNQWSRRAVLGVPIMLALRGSVTTFARQQTNLNELPANLPRPKDDGGARHLQGMALPNL